MAADLGEPKCVACGRSFQVGDLMIFLWKEPSGEAIFQHAKGKVAWEFRCH